MLFKITGCYNFIRCRNPYPNAYIEDNLGNYILKVRYVKKINFNKKLFS